MPGESKVWRPGHWTPGRRGRFEAHVIAWMEIELNQFLGPYEGAKLAAELRGHRATIKSIEGLRNAGVRTLGEVAE